MSKKNEMSRQGFSLRRLMLQSSQVTVSNRQTTRNFASQDGKLKMVCEKKSCHSEQHFSTYDSLQNSSTLNASVNNMQKQDKRNVCPICYNNESLENLFFQLEICKHSFCKTCMVKYLKNEINESRTDIACPQCSMAIHPNNIEVLLKDCSEFISKYEDFMIRRYLVTDPDSRWCPAPDCSFAVIASSCASCPQIKCMRPGCGLNFCYHCKAEWHPGQTCDAAKNSRYIIRESSQSFSIDSQRDEIKPCPRCQVLIVKMNDGSCNHMICSVCGAEFCWLCMKEVSDLHYLSPSGCTFWGKKPWSRKKKFFWQLGTLIGAPIGIAILAGIAIPSIVIGIPVWVGRKLLERHKSKTKQKRSISVIIGVTASILISPALAGLTIAIGIPILLFYVYGVVPVSLCRASCASSENDNFKFCADEENPIPNGKDEFSVCAVSKIHEAGIGDVTIRVTSDNRVEMQNGLAEITIHGPCRLSTGNINNENSDYQMDEISTGNFSGKNSYSEKYVKSSNNSTSALAGSRTSFKNNYSDECSISSAGTFISMERSANKESEFSTQSTRRVQITNTAIHRKFTFEARNKSCITSEGYTEC